MNEKTKTRSVPVRKRVKTTCSFCGKEYSIKHSHFQRKYKNYFCSRLCCQKNTKGRKLTPEHKIKLSEANKGRRPYQMTDKIRDKIRKTLTGRKMSLEALKKLSEGRKGEKSHFWKGGITKKSVIIRNSLEYKLWREAVFERDNFTCVWCGIKSGKGIAVILNADHIKPFAHYPELRFAIDNGRTLCRECHKTTDTFAGKSKGK